MLGSTEAIKRRQATATKPQQQSVLTWCPVDTVPLQLKQQLLLAYRKLLQLEDLIGSHMLWGGRHIRVKWQVPSDLYQSAIVIARAQQLQLTELFLA